MTYVIDPHGKIISYLKVIMLLLLSLTGSICRESRMVVWLQFQRRISFQNVTTSLSCSIDLSKEDLFEFQSGWMRQVFGCRTLPLSWLFPAVNTLSLVFSLAQVAKRCWNLPLKHPLIWTRIPGLDVCVFHAALFTSWWKKCAIPSRSNIFLMFKILHSLR